MPKIRDITRLPTVIDDPEDAALFLLGAIIVIGISYLLPSDTEIELEFE